MGYTPLSLFLKEATTKMVSTSMIKIKLKLKNGDNDDSNKKTKLETKSTLKA